MPRAAKKCPQPRCPHVQPCPAHPPAKPWAGSTRHDTLPPDWKQRKRKRHEIDNWTCVDCGHHDPTGRTLECDHDGDRNDHRIESLRTRCSDQANGCHRKRTQAQANQGRPKGR